jgi:hypothetical protein
LRDARDFSGSDLVDLQRVAAVPLAEAQGALKRRHSGTETETGRTGDENIWDVWGACFIGIGRAAGNRDNIRGVKIEKGCKTAEVGGKPEAVMHESSNKSPRRMFCTCGNY